MNTATRTLLFPLVVLTLGACSGSDSGPAGSAAGTGGGAGMGTDSGTKSLPPGASELTISTDHLTVAPATEIYKCQDMPNPFGKDVAIIHSESTMTKGSHHLQVFVMPESSLTLQGFTDCPNGGLEFHDFIHGSQKPEFEITYPEGVGRFLSKTMGIRIILHILNSGTSEIEAFADTKFTYVDPSEVQNLAGSVLLVNAALSVPPGDSTKTASYTLPNDIKMMGAVSHMHSRAVHFIANTDKGDTLYETSQWDEPTENKFSPALDLAAGTKITWSCDFHNTTSQTLTFGESALKNEMCNLFGSFYGGDGKGTSILQTVFMP